jgi:hypothetical protein
MSKEKSTRTGGSASLLLFTVFLVLKLTDTIDWSWWWVTSPLWIPLALAVGLLIFFGLLILLGLTIRK